MIKNVADESQVRDSKVRVKLSEDKEVNDLKFLLATEQGRRFIWRQLEFCGIYKQSADNSGSWTYFNEGKRSVGLKLVADVVNVDPDSYVKMIKESKKD